MNQLYPPVAVLPLALLLIRGIVGIIECIKTIRIRYRRKK